MTAYGALISLQNTIQNIWTSYYQSPFTEILIAAYKEVHPLYEILERLDGSSKSKSRKKVNSLDGRMKQTLWNLEDLLESLLSIGIHTGRSGDDLDEAKLLYTQLYDAVDSFIQALEDMKEEYNYEVDNMPQDDEEEEAAISSSSASARMIGLCDELEHVKFVLTEYSRGFTIMSYTLVGMAGLGKTTLVREIYEDPDIQRCYDCRVWITVGRKYDFNQVSRSFLDQLLQGGERCLIVLDDVWETEVLPIFLTSLTEMQDDPRRSIRILITARGRNAIIRVLNTIEVVNNTICWSFDRALRFLNEEESKDLLCNKVFGEQEICPPQLDKAATKIAKNCEGLPLMILTVAQHLSNRREPEYWNDVAEERNSVFTDSYEEISKVLFPSYDYLPQRLKMTFMFMGVFPRDYDVPASKIVHMLSAEGWLLVPNKHHSLEESATSCLAELCTTYHLVLFRQKTSEWYRYENFTMPKSFRLHSSWRHLCRREARNNKFFHVLNKLVDATSSHSHPHSNEEDEEAKIVIKGQRGLCLENNLLFGLKEFCSSVKSYCAFSTRFLLFYGPYHQYPTPIDSIGFKLLRELDALQLRFYTFPTQVLTLAQLKYLALTCNQQLPTTISKLSKLQILIIHPHISIVTCHSTTPSSIPVEIWDMPKLEHIEISGKSLRFPNNVDACLRNLSTLKGVNADISTISELSKRIPNIQKLGVQMELTPYHDTNNSNSSGDLISSFFECISTLGSLKTLKCSIMNPVLVRPPTVGPSSSLTMLPRGLKKLNLSGLGFPWEYMMDAIASLPDLQVLKLRCHAFRGPKWEIGDRSFLQLQYLKIEDSDLVEWKPGSGSFPQLNHLSLKHCYKLKELRWPSDFEHGKIELDNCSPLAVTCARQLPTKPDHFIEIVASDDFQG